MIDLLSIHWILGDLLNFAEGKFGDLVSQLQHEWGFKYDTYNSDRWVAKNFEFIRRRTKILIEHSKYKEIAALEKEDQKIWIKKILDENDNFEHKKIYGKEIVQCIGISF